ncbi:MAG: carbon-nitrogen hydrolase family protein [Pseudomonadota bacterium]
MPKTFTAACVQNCATPNVQQNIETSLRLSAAAAAAGAQLIVTPEYFSGLETRDGLFLPGAYPEAEHPVLPAFADAACKLGVWFLLGSIGVQNTDGRISNRSYMISPEGDLVAHYDKIHMFDVNLDGGSYRESATISPGDQAIVADTPWARVGLSICYDLRFAALYRQLAKAGAQVLATPAAFTRVTGEAHWHVLQRARAIETGCFVLAPCQYGKISGGGECYGHSLIIDPWGEVLADAGDGEGYIVAELDLARVEAARGRIPALEHDRPIHMGDQALGRKPRFAGSG